MKLLKGAMSESLSSVLPIAAIVILLSISISPLDAGILVLFIFGTLLLIAGMSLFTIGSKMSMQPLGEGIGVQINKTKSIIIPLVVCFVLGALITIAEPDLQVLAEQVPSIPNLALILSVAVGVGIFLALSMIRTRRGIPLSKMLLVFYSLAGVLAIFAPSDFIPTAFDSGGVALGPMTTTFMLPFAVGACEALGYNGLMMILSTTAIGRITSELILRSTQDVEFEGYENAMASEYQHSLIFITVNQGYTDAVMQTAKKAGATGGTVIRARMTGAEQSEHLSDLQIQDEKEIVAIFAPDSIRNEIMNAVNRDFGIRSETQGVICSIPVDKAFKI